MKDSKKCPKCENEDIYHQAKIPTAGGLFGTATLGLQDTPTSTKGTFEVFICKGCGFSELYLSDEGKEYLKTL